MILGCRQCVGTSNTVHLQCAFSLFDILAYIRNHGRAIIRGKIFQGKYFEFYRGHFSRHLRFCFSASMVMEQHLVKKLYRIEMSARLRITHGKTRR